MSSSTDAVIQNVQPEFVHEGDERCCPIPRDAANIKSAEFPTIKAIDGTHEEWHEKYDQSSNAQRMMKGKYDAGHFTHISIPFSSSSPMKSAMNGAYICLYGDSSSPSHLIFTLTSSKGEKTSKKYKFPEVEGFHWHFLPVDLPDIVLCEITGKGREEEYFEISSLVFISREETPEEIKSCEAREKLWSEAPVVKSVFVKEGDKGSEGKDSIPIPRDDPKLVDPSFSMVKCKNDAYSKESGFYDMSSRAQRMLKGKDFVSLSHLSIPFPSPSPMKGAYICVGKDSSSPSLLFTFSDCDGKKTSKKYEFTKHKHVFQWHFLPIDLDNVVLCEIEGKGMWCEKNSRWFNIISLVFLRGDDIPTSPPLLTPVPVPSSSSKTPTSTLSLPSKSVTEEGEQEEENSIQMSSSTDAVIQTVGPEFVHEGDSNCCPIPGDAANIKSVAVPTIEAIDRTKEEGDHEYDQSSEAIDGTQEEWHEKYDQSSNAQKMMKEECNDGHFTHISIPFSSFSPMNGAYICLYGDSWIPPPSHLIFTLTSSKGEKTSKKYEFPEFEGEYWYFLPVDLPDIVLCEITGKGREEEWFKILSLVFISREETPEEIKSCEAREKLWSETPVVKSVFVKEGDYKSEGRDSIPIPRDDPKFVNPSFSIVKCKLDAFSKESKEYDQSSDAQRMLKGEDSVWLSHLSIPFPSPSPMKGAYICVHQLFSSPSLLFTFTDCDGKKIFKKYEFIEPEHEYEWHFLPIDLDNVVLCEIEGKGRWMEKNSRSFYIESLVFLRGDDIPTSPPLLTPVPVPSSSSKTPTSTLSLPSKTVTEEGEQEEENSIQMSSSTDAVIQTVGPEFVHEGDSNCCPIPGDAANIKSVAVPTIEAIDRTKEEGDHEYDQSSEAIDGTQEEWHEKYDQSSNAQKMMKEECNDGHFTHISIPFSSFSPMKSAYICLDGGAWISPPSYLIFTLTSSKGEKTSKKYEFPGFRRKHWYFLPVDLPDVVLCEITGKGIDTEYFEIQSLVFIREETPEEIKSREAREKLWSEAPVVKPEFVKEGNWKSWGRDSPIPRDDPKLVDPSFSIVKCKNDAYSKESGFYDMSSRAQRMLKGKDFVSLSHLSIPFPSPSPMKGAYICVGKDSSSPSLLFTFTDCDGKKIFKKYEFTEPKYPFEWHFLPIDLDNVVLCEIEGEGRWMAKNSRWFEICSLVFTTFPKELIAAERLSLLPWK
ncbi:hypothetical protein ADUPG1_008574 [Aduncisulcus paluster]|uniref:Uncharacterized protein n=1 Tax=Aduncisulcus paluster TaxID=2918883 RepID=A0ABQ5KSG2_9EUKA|nr:hypothetical protein ADUPG1_008574 [Aduncisulcus paluster]